MENTTQISYDRLWKLLIDRKLKKKGLQELTHLSPSVITKMGRNESVHLDTLGQHRTNDFLSAKRYPDHKK